MNLDSIIKELQEDIKTTVLIRYNINTENGTKIYHIELAPNFSICTNHYIVDMQTGERIIYSKQECPECINELVMSDKHV